MKMLGIKNGIFAVLALSAIHILSFGSMASSSFAEELFDKKLSGQEIKELLSGNTVVGVNLLKRREFIYYFSSDGNASGTSQNNAEKAVTAGLRKQSDSGKWWIDGDTRCSQWTQWNDGKPDCANVFKKGDQYLVFRQNEDGSNSQDIRGTFQVVTGNPHSL